MGFKQYPDGTSYYEIDGERPIFTFKVNTYDDLWKLGQKIETIFYNSKMKCTVILPWLIDSQADRRFHQYQSFGLKQVCNYLNSLPARYKIFHPHNPEVVEALLDDVEIISNEKFIKNVLNKIDNEYKFTDKTLESNLILMSSDAGGFKPLMKLCDKLDWKGETTSASKYRNNGNPLIQVLDRDDYENKDILIVDDISVYGGTFKGLSKLLKERNCGKLYLAVSHMTIQNLGEDPVTNYFDKVFTTNSKYDKYYTENEDPYANALGSQPNNLEIIKLF